MYSFKLATREQLEYWRYEQQDNIDGAEGREFESTMANSVYINIKNICLSYIWIHMDTNLRTVHFDMRVILSTFLQNDYANGQAGLVLHFPHMSECSFQMIRHIKVVTSNAFFSIIFTYRAYVNCYVNCTMKAGFNAISSSVLLLKLDKLYMI